MPVSVDDVRDKTIFVGMSDEQIEKLLGCSEPVAASSGDAIVSKDEPGESMYVILEGEVEVRDVYGDEQTPITRLSGDAALRSQYEGDFFGEMSLLDTELRSTTVVALEDCRLLKMSRDALAGVFEGDTALHLVLISNMARVLSRRLRCANPKMS